jgi:hypothetical protein
MRSLSKSRSVSNGSNFVRNHERRLKRISHGDVMSALPSIPTGYSWEVSANASFGADTNGTRLGHEHHISILDSRGKAISGCVDFQVDSLADIRDAAKKFLTKNQNKLIKLGFEIPEPSLVQLSFYGIYKSE